MHIRAPTYHHPMSLEGRNPQGGKLETMNSIRHIIDVAFYMAATDEAELPEACLCHQTTLTRRPCPREHNRELKPTMAKSSKEHPLN